MTYFPEPLKPSEGRDEDHLIVNPVEADKKGKEDPAKGKLPPEKKGSAMYGAFLGFFSGFIDAFKPREVDESARVLNSLNLLLEELKSADQNEHPKFAEQFSALWIALLKGVQAGALPKLSSLIEEIDNYPPSEDHKLGFYLEKHAGEGWLPIPFREILKGLHNDHRIHQEHSTLTKWTESISELLQG